MTESALLNGKSASSIAVTDRGLHYGDGVFRTLRMRAGEPEAWAEHWQRLEHDCRRLDIAIPAESLLVDEYCQLFTDRADGVLKIIITRGSGGRGYTSPRDITSTRLLLRYPLPPPLPAQLHIGICQLRLGRNPVLAGIKHLNRLEQVLARRECREAGWDEALLLDEGDQVISGTMSNLFVVSGGELLTPMLDQAGVIGATRQRIMHAAQKAGVACRETPLRLRDCVEADELFLCNSIIGVRPVTGLGEQHYASGELTRWCTDQLKTK